MRSHWVLGQEESRSKEVAQEFKIHPAIANILLRRGLKTSSEIFSFLNPSFEALESPFAFEYMQKAVDRIRRAISTNEKILVYGDYDVDGITGCAVLFPVLKKLGANVDAHIPHRVTEGYGLNIQSLKNLIEQKKFTLLITVDNGISALEPIQFLNSQNVDVIIVDHHKPKGEVPQAYAIVSAAVGQKKGDANLAACGVAFKLAWALCEKMEDVKEYLDLVSIGTVADITPVTGDNRIILKYGLPILAQGKRPGIAALMDVSRISRNKISFRDIAFGLAPRINASGRMGSPLDAFHLLTTSSAEEARKLACFLDEGNKDRQRIEAEAFQSAAKIVESNYMARDEKILVVENQEWHEGVIGIVAARLVERFKKPSIVISLKENEEKGKGSGRSVPLFSLFDSVVKFEHLLESFGGHPQACGLTIKKENIATFRKKLNEDPGLFESLQNVPPLNIDSLLPFEELDLKFLKDLERLAPFGPANPKPLFLSKGLKLKGVPKKRGKDTLSCWMASATGKTVCEVVGFRAYERWTKSPQDIYDMVYQPTLNEFNGITSIQLELEDWG